MTETLTPEARNLQQELPDGLILQKELVGSQAWEANDERYGADQPITRVVRFVRVEPAWRSEVLSRLQCLASTKLTHVETPLEAGWIEGQAVLFHVERPYQSLLVTHLSAQGLPVDEAQSIFKSLVAGVEELHAQRLLHGDLRPGNIVLRQTRPVLEVGIGNTVTGPLQFWAGGQIVNDELHRYLPPEANGAIVEPSAAADLYALGVIGCELFLGHNAMQTLAGKSIELGQALKERSVPRATRMTLLKLLDTNPQNRPRQAQDVQRSMQTGVAVWLERTVLAIVIVLLFALSIHGGLSNRTLSDELNTAGNDLNAAQTQITSLTRSNKEVQQMLKESEARFDSEVERSADRRKQIEGYQTQITSSANDVSVIRSALEDSFLPREQLVTRIQRIIGQSVPADEQLWGDYRQSMAADDDDDQHLFDDWLDSYQPSIAETDASQLRAWRQQVTAVREALADAQQPLVGYQQEPWSQAAQQQQAQVIWKKWCAGSHSGKALIESLRKARSKLPQTHPVDQLLTQWQRSLAGLGIAAGNWLEAKTGDAVAAEILKRVHAALQAPWSSESWKATETYCRAAGRAAGIWNQFANDPDLNWSYFGTRLTNAAKAESESLQPDLEKILKVWIAEFEKRSGAMWKLQLVKGEVKAPKDETVVPDYGNDRMFNLYRYSGDEQVKHIDVKHSWSTAATHSYAKSKHEFVDFHWKVGEPIELLLEQDGYTANDNLVEQVFDGPVSIWRLHTQRRIWNPTTGVSLEFRIVDCPGPPKEVLEGITSALGRVSAP